MQVYTNEKLIHRGGVFDHILGRGPGRDKSDVGFGHGFGIEQIVLSKMGLGNIQKSHRRRLPVLLFPNEHSYIPGFFCYILRCLPRTEIAPSAERWNQVEPKEQPGAYEDGYYYTRGPFLNGGGGKK